MEEQFKETMKHRLEEMRETYRRSLDIRKEDFDAMNLDDSVVDPTGWGERAVATGRFICVSPCSFIPAVYCTLIYTTCHLLFLFEGLRNRFHDAFRIDSLLLEELLRASRVGPLPHRQVYHSIGGRLPPVALGEALSHRGCNRFT